MRKFVISKDGTVDVGVAQFVKWAMRIIASTSIFQVCCCINVVMLTRKVSVRYLAYIGFSEFEKYVWPLPTLG